MFLRSMSHPMRSYLHQLHPDKDQSKQILSQLCSQLLLLNLYLPRPLSLHQHRQPLLRLENGADRGGTRKRNPKFLIRTHPVHRQSKHLSLRKPGIFMNLDLRQLLFIITSSQRKLKPATVRRQECYPPRHRVTSTIRPLIMPINPVLFHNHLLSHMLAWPRHIVRISEFLRFRLPRHNNQTQRACPERMTCEIGGITTFKTFLVRDSNKWFARCVEEAAGLVSEIRG